MQRHVGYFRGDGAMIDCTPEPRDGRYVCTVCGYGAKTRRPIVEPFRRNCPKSPELLAMVSEAQQRLGIGDKAKHYAAALARWAWAGFPTRPPAEVERIYRECCKPCEHYDNGGCKLCGCCVSRKRLAIRNKLAMGTESCPIGRWSAL